jgi:hypothetical protein
MSGLGPRDSAAAFSRTAANLNHPAITSTGRSDARAIDFESLSSVGRCARCTRSWRKLCAVTLSENAYFRDPDGTCTHRSVINLQHTDSFDAEPSQTHKNAAIGDGFCLLVFLKMALVLVRRTSAMAMGT